MSSLSYDIPSNRKVASILDRYEKMQRKLHPGPTFLELKQRYHGGAILPGNSGHDLPYEYDPMSVKHPLSRPIGLPKPRGGKSKMMKRIEEIGEYIKPVAKPILTAATSSIVRKLEGKKPKQKRVPVDLIEESKPAVMEGSGRSGGARSGGRTSGGGRSGGCTSGGARSGGSKAARGQMVSRLMKEKGMSLGEASKYIKEHGM